MSDHPCAHEGRKKEGDAGGESQHERARDANALEDDADGRRRDQKHGDAGCLPDLASQPATVRERVSHSSFTGRRRLAPVNS